MSILAMIVVFIALGAALGLMQWKEDAGTSEEVMPLIIEGKEIEETLEPYIAEEGIYLPYEIIKTYISDAIELSEDAKRIFLPLKGKTVRLEDEKLTGFIQENEVVVNFPTKDVGGYPYILLSLLEKIEGFNSRIDERERAIVIEKTDTDQVLNHKREPFTPPKEPINLAWEYVHEKSPNLSDEEKIHALDVIAPTWFSVVDERGTVINKANKSYVEEAHKKGYQVWALVDNSFKPDLTSKILNDEALRKKVIGQLVFYASLYNLDGINVDFENMYYKDKAVFVRFMKELREQIDLQNLVLSVDITVPSSSEQWSKVYDRKALGQIVDYVAVMTYDEHWGSSPLSGSVASIGWVEKGIEKSLELIPEEKMLIGLPFYTRVWREYKDEKGKNKVDSKAISMARAREIVEEKEAEVVWDEKAGQYFVQYQEEQDIYKIWLEDPRSISLKASLVSKYQLAGTAAWRRGFEEQEVWNVLHDMTKKGKKHDELVFHESFQIRE